MNATTHQPDGSPSASLAASPAQSAPSAPAEQITIGEMNKEMAPYRFSRKFRFPGTMGSHYCTTGVALSGRSEGINLEFRWTTLDGATVPPNAVEVFSDEVDNQDGEYADLGLSWDKDEDGWFLSDSDGADNLPLQVAAALIFMGYRLGEFQVDPEDQKEVDALVAQMNAQKLQGVHAKVEAAAPSDEEAHVAQEKAWDEAGHALALAPLPDFPSPLPKCCENPAFKLIERGYTRCTNLDVDDRDGTLTAYTDGFDDYSENGILSYVECVACEKRWAAPSSLEWA